MRTLKVRSYVALVIVGFNVVFQNFTPADCAARSRFDISPWQVRGPKP